MYEFLFLFYNIMAMVVNDPYLLTKHLISIYMKQTYVKKTFSFKWAPGVELELFVGIGMFTR